MLVEVVKGMDLSLHGALGFDLARSITHTYVYQIFCCTTENIKRKM